MENLTIAMTDLNAKDVMPSAAYFADFASSYSEEIDQLLIRSLPSGLNEVIRDFVESFYVRLTDGAESAAILARLTPRIWIISKASKRNI